MTPKEFAEEVEAEIRASYESNEDQAKVITGIGDVGVYLPPDSIIFDFRIDESFREQGYGEAGLRAATTTLQDIGSGQYVRATIRQTTNPCESYADAGDMSNDPTHILLANCGFTRIHEAPSTSNNNQYMFEAVY